MQRMARAAMALGSFVLVLPALAMAKERKATAQPSLVQALHAAEASLRRIPGDDIERDFRPAWTGVADLDGDGQAEIVYFYTSTYTGGAFAQHNRVVVMTALSADDPRGRATPNSLSTVDAEDAAAVRVSGYADDSGLQIPGAVQSINIEGSRIRVAFSVTSGASVCEAVKFKHICPPDGDQQWVLQWTPGTLKRTGS